MVSFQMPSPPREREITSIIEIHDHDLRRKRKWEEPPQGDQVALFDERSKDEVGHKSIFEIELQLETPLPLDWQRCLDIQSGKIHFYNTWTQKRTSRDPRTNIEPPSSPHGHMSLDLELNLPCESQRRSSIHAKEKDFIIPRLNNTNTSIMGKGSDLRKDSSKDNPLGGLPRRPSWLACEGDHQEEMVATVCNRCHMLVMLCKSSPACPNCKFMHPTDQSPPMLFKQSLKPLVLNI